VWFNLFNLFYHELLIICDFSTRGYKR
jgi:hypothetical protein